MDRRAAEQYLETLFGQAEGHIAVAYKDQGQSWNERSFAWPAEKGKLLRWAEIHHDGNLFICPALRKSESTRKKADMQPSRWLWADVDWQSIPADRVADVKARIAELSCFTVASGTGDNMHVYVQLKTPVPHEQFIKLNTGLRDYLLADNKQADNSLLRLPGTTNWKTEEGSPVREVSRNAAVMAPAVLMRRRAFRDAKVPVDVDASDWSMVDVSLLGLPRRTMRLLEMTPKESLGRYGARNKAVYAAVKELHKKGLDADQIHSLMDKFPPALDKAAEENGYDRHLDIDRCLARIRQAEDAIPSIEEQVNEVFEESEDAFEELSAEEAESEDFNDRVKRILLERSIRRAADMAEAEAGHAPPPEDTSCSLSDLLARPPAPQQYLIQDMCSTEGFVVIVGQYKTGKTLLMTNSLIRSLADDEPFLGAKEVHVPEGGIVCGHWNLEMTALDLIDKYMRKAQFKNPHNVHIANWQGYGVNLLTEPGKQMAVDWLTTRAVKVWTIDSWTALCRSAGVDPNDGAQVGALAQAIIDIKVRAGVQAVFLLAHISRGSQESDRPGTKGAVDLDAIVDTRWMMTIDKSDVRFLQVEGRGTTMPATSLDFNEETGHSTLGTAGRANAAADGWVQTVMSIVNGYPQGVNGTTLYTKMVERGHPKNKTKAMEYVKEAETSGFIRMEQAQPTGRGGRPQMMHYPAHSGPVEGDRTRQATARDVDFKHVKVPGGRRRTATE